MADYRGIGDEPTIKAAPGESLGEFAEPAVTECRKYGGAAAVTFNGTTIHIGTAWEPYMLVREFEDRLLAKGFPLTPSAAAAREDKVLNEGISKANRKPATEGTLYEWPADVFARTEPAQPALNVLAEAARITSGDRNTDYGHPADNHEATAQLYTAYLRRRYGADIPDLDARAVCMLNVLQKISRDAYKPKRDNLIDIAGYIRNIEMLDDER